MYRRLDVWRINVSRAADPDRLRHDATSTGCNRGQHPCHITRCAFRTHKKTARTTHQTFLVSERQLSTSSCVAAFVASTRTPADQLMNSRHTRRPRKYTRRPWKKASPTPKQVLPSQAERLTSARLFSPQEKKERTPQHHQRESPHSNDAVSSLCVLKEKPSDRTCRKCDKRCQPVGQNLGSFIGEVVSR